MFSTRRPASAGPSTVTRAQLRASLDDLSEDALLPVATTLAVLYAFYTVAYGVQLHKPGATIGFGMSGLTAAFFAVLRFYLRRFQPPRALLNPLGTLYSLVVGVNCLVSEAATHNAELSPNLMLTIAAIPLLLLNIRYLILVESLLAAGWFLVQNTALVGTSWHIQTYPLIASVVVAGLVYGVRVRSQRRLEEARYALQRAAVIDELTGLYNRRGFLETAQGLLDACRRERVGVVLLFADVDGLKQINDTLGHHAGDQVLRAAAAVLGSTFRSDDVVGRLGGDEFAVLLREPADGTVPAERLLAAVAAAADVASAGAVLSLSVGVALAGPADPLADEPLEALLSRGDQAMYRGRRKPRTARLTG